MKHITRAQRYAIKAYLNCGKGKKKAELIGVHKSTIYHELNRNKSKRGVYNADHAHELAQERKERYNNPRKLNINMKMKIDNWVKKEQWSPEQIKGYCGEDNDIEMVSRERINQYIRDDKAQGGDLYTHLRHQLKHRKRPVSGKQQNIKNKTSIDERPDVINNKERFGDWEIDLIIGKNQKGAIQTLVERQTAMILIRKLEKGKNAEGLAQTVIDMLLPFKPWVKSITSDNGSEFAQHEKNS